MTGRDHNSRSVELATVESSAIIRHFRNRSEAHGIKMVVANSAEFKVVAESVKRIDWCDAVTLAEFFEKEMLPETRLCSEDSEELRRLIMVRATLVKVIVSKKKQLHGVLLSMRIGTQHGQLQGRRVQNALAAHNGTRAAVDPVFKPLNRVWEQVKKLEKLIEQRTAANDIVPLNRTIPAAGLISATTIRAFIDDIRCFATAGKLVAYAGVVPCVQNSKLSEHYGRITKCGPNQLRKAMESGGSIQCRVDNRRLSNLSVSLLLGGTCETY